MTQKSLAPGLLMVLMISVSASGVTFNNVVSLGDSLLDDPDDVRSPVSAEHVAQRLGAPLTKLAMSGATSAELILNGQHTQAASQFGAGDLAMLWIGGNDMFNNFLGVPLGFFGFIDDLEANVDSTLSTLRGAGMDVVVFNLPDLSKVPATSIISNYREATQMWNDRLNVLADTHGATVVDVFDLFERINDDPNEFSLLGNTPILEAPPIFGDCQFCVFADAVHPASFAQGFIANEAIAAINDAFDPAGTMPLEPLSIVEIASLADVRAGDFDGNGTVNAADLTRWLADYGDAGSDADGDGDTDGGDFLIWQQRLEPAGELSSVSVTVPEPTTASLAFLLLSAQLVATVRRR